MLEKCGYNRKKGELNLLKKGEKLDVESIDNGMNFEGIARKDDLVIFVPNAIKGEIVRFELHWIDWGTLYGFLFYISNR